MYCIITALQYFYIPSLSQPYPQLKLRARLAGVTAKGTGPQGRRAGVNADLTPSTGGPVGHACR